MLPGMDSPSRSDPPSQTQPAVPEDAERDVAPPSVAARGPIEDGHPMVQPYDSRPRASTPFARC